MQTSQNAPGQARSRTRKALAALALFGLLLGACGNSGSDSTPESAAPTPTQPEVTQPSATEPATVPAGTQPTDATTPVGTTPVETTPVETTPPGPDLGEFQPIEGVPGVTDDQISFAVMGTGPANPLGYCLLECYKGGVQAYFEYRNSIGGVHGRDVVIGRTEDDEFGNTQVKLLELIEDDATFGIFAAPLQYPGFADVGATDVPMFTTFPAAVDANGHDNIYIPVGTMCVLCPSPMAVWGASLGGATKVASLGFGISQASKDCANRYESEVNKWGPALGMEFVYRNDDLPFGFPNGLGPEVTAMKEAGVDYIMTCIDQNSALILEQELERQGVGDTVVALPQGYGDTEFITSNAALLEGDLLSVAFHPLEADPGTTMVPTMIEWLTKGGHQINDYAIQGWLGADLAVTGLLAAGPTFDQASMVAATNTLTDFTGGGLVPTVDWTKKHTAPTEDEANRICASFVKVQDGELVLAGDDPTKPFFCFDVPMDTWTAPTQTSFG